MSGNEFDDTYEKKFKVISKNLYQRLRKKGLAAVSASFFASLCCAFGRYDVVHIHAEGPAFFCWIPKLLSKKVIVTVHGIDWQREKCKFGLSKDSYMNVA